MQVEPGTIYFDLCQVFVPCPLKVLYQVRREGVGATVGERQFDSAVLLIKLCSNRSRLAFD
jgi:hypothetical protein